MKLLHSPSFILRELLVGGSKLTRPADKLTWPGFIGSLPRGDNDPDEVVALYDTSPVIDGRSMRTGEVIRHPGSSIRVRSRKYDNGFTKAEDLLSYLTESVESVQVDIVEGSTTTSYMVYSVSLFSGIIQIPEEEVRARVSFVFNVVSSIYPI